MSSFLNIWIILTSSQFSGIYFLCHQLFSIFQSRILISLDAYFIISKAILSTLGCYPFLHFSRTSSSSEDSTGPTPTEGRKEETDVDFSLLSASSRSSFLDHCLAKYCKQFTSFITCMSAVFLILIKTFQYFVSIWLTSMYIMLNIGYIGIAAFLMCSLNHLYFCCLTVIIFNVLRFVLKPW
jgi:hypothetical protein